MFAIDKELKTNLLSDTVASLVKAEVLFDKEKERLSS
jgi:hypothetical protein